MMSLLKIKRCLPVLLFLFGGLCNSGSKAETFEYTPVLKESQKHVCELRLREAETLIQSEIGRRPENTAGYYLLHYLKFYRILIHFDHTQFADFENYTKQTLARIEKLPDNGPEKKFLKGSLYLQSAFVKGAFNEYLGAAWDFRKAYLEIRENEKKFPAYIGHKKELGALTALLGAFPQQYHWILHTVGYDGDYQEGLKILRDYLRKSQHEPIIEQQQATLILALMLLNFDQEKQHAWDFIRNHSADPTKNLMITYVKGYIASKSGHNDEALNILKVRPQGPEYENIAYLNIVYGTCLLQNLDPSAIIWFKRYFATSKTKASLKEASQKMAWAAWLGSDTIRYRTYIHSTGNNVKSSELNLVKSDLSQGIYPSRELLRARLLSDGGYFERAVLELNKISPVQLYSDFQRLEWHYRQARIAHEQERFADAIAQYKICLDFTESIPSYMVPNACLQLGIIYEHLHYFKLAVPYYQKVSSYSGFDYESSIHQKAHDALSRLK